jgi:pimeloyl-ACP methyl ester carboxylesterase
MKAATGCCRPLTCSSGSALARPSSRAPRLTVVAYDRRGFGDVAPAGGHVRLVDDLLAVLDAVSPDGPAWVGSSMGGEAALDEIAALILAEAA